MVYDRDMNRTGLSIDPSPWPEEFEAPKKRYRHYEYVWAHQELYEAVCKGLVTRPSSCEECGAVCKTEGHHHKGYLQPLNVLWLCRSCHAKKGITRRHIGLRPEVIAYRQLMKESEGMV